MMSVRFQRRCSRSVRRAWSMTRQTQLACGFDQVGIVARAMNIMAAEAGDAAPIHQALHENVALHSIFMGCSVREMGEGRLAQLVVFKPPEIFQIHPLMKADRPVVVLPIKGVL